MTPRGSALSWSFLAVVVMLLTGCLEAVLAEWDALLADGSSTGAGSSSSTGAPEVEPTGAIQTVTGGSTAPAPADTTDTASSTGEPGEPVVIEQFELAPSSLDRPGLSSVVFKVSDNVTSAALFLGGELVAQGPPGALAYTFEATSEDANGEYDFKLRALDGEGGSAEATAHLSVALPEHGALKCPFQDEVDAVHSEIASVVLGEHFIAAVGERNKGAGSRLSVWLIEREACGKIWQRPIDMWTQLPGVKDLPSKGVAVALDESGNLVIAGNIAEDAGTRPYLALLRSDGVLLWETTGDLGDEAAGVTRVPWPYEHVVMVGSRRTNLDPPRHDGLIKGYLTTTDSVWKDVIKAPLAADETLDDFNYLSERFLAVDFHPDTLEVVVVGEREFKPLDLPDTFQRTFTARYAPLGGRLGTWTSTGDYFPHDSARSLRWCGDAFLAGGWTRNLPGAEPQPLVRRFDVEGESLGRHADPFVGTSLYGVDCDREGKIVGAGVRDDGLQTDAFVYATKLPDQPPVWKVVYDGQFKGNDRALALDCDAWGYCAWGGYETLDGKPRAIVQLRFP